MPSVVYMCHFEGRYIASVVSGGMEVLDGRSHGVGCECGSRVCGLEGVGGNIDYFAFVIGERVKL